MYVCMYACTCMCVCRIPYFNKRIYKYIHHKRVWKLVRLLYIWQNLPFLRTPLIDISYEISTNNSLVLWQIAFSCVRICLLHTARGERKYHSNNWRIMLDILMRCPLTTRNTVWYIWRWHESLCRGWSHAEHWLFSYVCAKWRCTCTADNLDISAVYRLAPQLNRTLKTSKSISTWYQFYIFRQFSLNNVGSQTSLPNRWRGLHRSDWDQTFNRLYGALLPGVDWEHRYSHHVFLQVHEVQFEQIDHTFR